MCLGKYSARAPTSFSHRLKLLQVPDNATKDHPVTIVANHESGERRRSIVFDDSPVPSLDTTSQIELGTIWQHSFYGAMSVYSLPNVVVGVRACNFGGA